MSDGDALWDPDYRGCKMSGLPYDQCGCKHHARVEYVEEVGGSSSPSTREIVGECRACGDDLVKGQTTDGIYCSWICAMDQNDN